MKHETKINPPKLADDDGYRVAAEALQIATKYGVKDELFQALFDLVQREAKRIEQGK